MTRLTTQPNITIGGVKGLGAKVGAMVKLIAESVEEVTLSDCGTSDPKSRRRRSSGEY
jgi:hypothetical protein